MIKIITFFLILITSLGLFSCKEKPKTAQDYIDLGMENLKDKDYNKADFNFLKALAIEPNNTQALLGCISVKKITKDYKIALMFTDSAIRSNPQFSGLFYNLRGEIRIDMGDKDSACIDFMKAGNFGDKKSMENQDKYCK